MPKQYTEIFQVVKMKFFSRKSLALFLLTACSNEYPQYMFWSKNKKNKHTTANSNFSILKWGSWGYTFHVLDVISRGTVYIASPRLRVSIKIMLPMSHKRDTRLKLVNAKMPYNAYLSNL